MMEAGLVSRETWERFGLLSAPNQSYQNIEEFLTTQAGWLKTQRRGEKSRDHETQTERVKSKEYKRTERERENGEGTRVEEPNVYYERRKGVKEGGKVRTRRGRSQTWSQVQCAPPAPELWFIMKKFQGEPAESKPEVTERRARANSLPSCLHLHPLLCARSLHLYLVCSSVTFTLLALLWRVVAAHVCRRVNVSVFERQRRCGQSGWNPKTQHEHEGDRLSPHHAKKKKNKTQREMLFCVFVVV